MVTGNIDILVITERKLDSSFPNAQFIIDGFSEPYMMDRDRHGGGVLILFIEINLRKCKWLMVSTYHPPSQSDQYYFEYGACWKDLALLNI